MATSIVIDNLADGAEINFTGTTPNKRYAVTGSATPIAPETSVFAMGKQVDNEFVQLFPPNSMGTYNPFTFDITESECPNVNQWYMLAVHAWGNLGDHTIVSRSFKRLS